MPQFLDEQWHIVDGKVEKINQIHPLENLKDKTVFIERFKSLFGDDLQYEDISEGSGRLFKISYQGYEYNIYIEAVDSGGGRDKKKKIGIPSTKSKNDKPNPFRVLIDNYESVLIINEYVPLVRKNGVLEYADKSVYAVMKPKEVYSSKVIREKTGNASSRWIWFEDMLKCLEKDSVVMNRKENVYIVPSTRVKDFFDTRLIIEEYEQMSKYLFEKMKEEPKDIQRLENSITRIFRNNMIKQRYKKIDENHSVNCTCEFCNCNVNVPELLVASHINAKANIRNDDSLSDEEKYTLMTDINNGFLLCRTHDALFDKKYITLDEDGKLIVSERIKDMEKEFNIENLENTVVISSLSDKTKEYLKQHRLDFEEKQQKIKK